MSRPVPATCPHCDSGNTIRIAYGLPGPDLMEAADRGEVALGGCCIQPNQPSHRCEACGTAFVVDGSDERWSFNPMNRANDVVGAEGLEPPTSAL